MKKTMLSIALAVAAIPLLGQTPFVVGATNSVVAETTPYLDDAIGVSAGASHALAVCSDGCVIAWGGNTNGECDVPSDLTETGAVVAVTVSGGREGSVAVDADGNLWAWGKSSTAPSSVQSTNLVDAQTGVSNTVVLTEDGIAQAVTYSGWPLLSFSNVASIATCNDGLAWRYGVVLNVDTNDSASIYNVRLYGYYGMFFTNVPPQVSNIVQLVLWTNGTVALRADGTAFKWGSTGGAMRAAGTYVGLSGGGSSVYGTRADGSQVWIIGTRLTTGTNALPSSIVPVSLGGGFGVGILNP